MTPSLIAATILLLCIASVSRTNAQDEWPDDLEDGAPKGSVLSIEYRHTEFVEKFGKWVERNLSTRREEFDGQGRISRSRGTESGGFDYVFKRSPDKITATKRWGTVKARAVYELDDDGRIIEVSAFDAVDGSTAGRLVREYDDDGRIVAETQYDESGDEQHTTRYIYVGRELISKINRTPGSRLPNSAQIYTLDSLGRQQFLYDCTYYDTSKCDRRSEYIYDNNGRAVQQIFFKRHTAIVRSADWDTIDVVAWQYDAQGKPVERASWASLSKDYRAEYVYDTQGNWTSRKYYNHVERFGEIEWVPSWATYRKITYASKRK
jgi:hypothetical protein